VFKAVDQLLLAYGSAEMGGDIPIVREQLSYTEENF
jgi:hypothetical protein